jgi:hypothetical protein
MHRAIVIHVGILDYGGLPGDDTPYRLALASLRHFVDGLTVQSVRERMTEWPEGPGQVYLLPALVQAGEGV